MSSFVENSHLEKWLSTCFFNEKSQQEDPIPFQSALPRKNLSSENVMIQKLKLI